MRLQNKPQVHPGFSQFTGKKGRRGGDAGAWMAWHSGKDIILNGSEDRINRDVGNQQPLEF